MYQPYVKFLEGLNPYTNPYINSYINPYMGFLTSRDSPWIPKAISDLGSLWDLQEDLAAEPWTFFRPKGPKAQGIRSGSP